MWSEVSFFVFLACGIVWYQKKAVSAVSKGYSQLSPAPSALLEGEACVEEDKGFVVLRQQEVKHSPIHSATSEVADIVDDNSDYDGYLYSLYQEGFSVSP